MEPIESFLLESGIIALIFERPTEVVILFAVVTILFIIAALNIRSSRQKASTARAQADDLLAKYGAIISVEAAVAEATATHAELSKDIEDIRATYKEKRSTLDKLTAKLAVYDDRLALGEMGVYEPHFDFGTSENYKQQIVQVRDQQKAMIKEKTAVRCYTEWQLHGSIAQGRTMTNRQIRLTLRAFNNEADAAIANARWNNALAMEKRILNASVQINKMNKSNDVEISDDYIDLKIEELQLTHEYKEKQKEERDKKAEIKRAETEEKRLQAAARKAFAKEKEYEDLLAKVRKEVGVDERRIAELEALLETAHDEAERAKSLAERTKSGFVYIISNVGSFGEDVVKIGLTRRLDPDDRVKELGDASVPFGFDTHAMIYSDEAPTLETSLHQKFNDKRVNMSNLRKEFFRVSIDEVQKAVEELAPEATFITDREAQEWQETLLRREEKIQLEENKEEDFPLEI